MRIITKTLVWTVVCLFLSTSAYNSNITIIESQSIHPLHKMDDNWKNIAEALGHNASIEDQTFLDAYSNFSNTDILIIASGLIDIPENRKANILQFVQDGGSLYLQSEYLMNLPGNELFVEIADSYGNSFNWEGEESGDLEPMQIIGSLSSGLPDGDYIDYYWYGTYGAGDANFETFLTYDNKDWGFIYCPSDLMAGKVITTSDQDWIRTSSKNSLMSNILTFLSENLALEALPEVSITSTNDPCDDTYNFDATIINNVPGIGIEWLVNGQVVANQNGLSFSSNSLIDGDVVECRISYSNACAAYNHVSNPILIAPIFPTSAPEVTISVDNNSFCQGQTATFTANTTQTADLTNYSFQWLVNAMPVNGATNPTFSTDQLNDLDEVHVLFTYDDACNSGAEIHSDTITVYVTDALNPMVSITANLTEICEGDAVTFTANGSDLGSDPVYQWQVNGTNVGTNENTFTTTSLTNGQSINCLILISNQCSTTNEAISNTISMTVYEVVTPAIEIISNATTVCEGTPITFTANASGLGANPTFQWQIDGNNVGSNQATFASDALEDGQEVTCILSVTETCATVNSVTSNTVAIAISSINIETLALINENCSNADGSIETTVIGGIAPYDFTWSNGGSEENLFNLVAGTYELTVTDANGCSAEITFEITEVEGPEITGLDVVPADCEGNNGHAYISVNVDPNTLTIEWINDSGEVINNTLESTELEPGSYEIAVTNQWGCAAFETVYIEQVSSIAVAVNANERIDLGAAVQLEAVTNVSGNVSYEWFPADGLSCTDCPNPIASPTSDIEYTLIVTNESGCTASEDVMVTVVPRDDVFIPNAFSPDGDGVNDYFTVFAGANVAGIKTLRVFDRWGAEVYGNQGFMPNVETEGWNGTFKGKVMDMGVYIYYVEVEYIDGSVKIKKGDLTITK